jgi:DNA replication licensing factor MCM3
MRFALFREVPKRQHRKKRKLNSGAALRKGSDGSGGDDESDDSEDEQDPASASAERMVSPRAPPSRSSTRPARLPEDPIWGDESQDVPMTAEPPATVAAGDGTIRPER